MVNTQTQAMFFSTRLHGFKPCSQANGPGKRAVVWFQGCTLNCGGCGNPETHQPDELTTTPNYDIALKILEAKEYHGIEGVTFSGGEPLQQLEPLVELAEFCQSLGLSVIVSTGYTVEEITKLGREYGILSRIVDVMICGRYQKTRHIGRGFRGSSNKVYRIYSDRYRPNDFDSVKPFEVEVIDGKVNITGVGFDPAELAEYLT